ncbi:MAG: response regulator [Xanthomonadaceae bacterium]|jgi:signal transduction histidine kinase/CheY-like chemotaxis protein|nr:response regulator [Xanthomonadaceae bacterium]
MSEHARPPVLFIRLTIVTVVIALIFLLLAVMNIGGSWAFPVLATAVAGLIFTLLTSRQVRIQTQALQKALELNSESEIQLERLRNDLKQHNQLERELTDAKRAAEAAALSKGEFLATMSHEIRTPLNGIIPMLDLIAGGNLTLDQLDLLRTARESSLQLLRIVDDILDYSKLDANRVELETTSFNLRDALDGIVQLIRRPAENKGLQLQLQLDPAVRLPVRGDPVRLRQVLSNLVSNAIKFTEHGVITIGVKRLGETSFQHLLRFEVHDTGIGISEDQQARLFNSFTQADASITRLYGGTGLGLAISKRIVDLMGGRIGVSSKLGQGSTFWFEVPLFKVIGDIDPQAQSAENSRILVITPDMPLHKQLSALLPTWGLQATFVETTRDALERLRQPTPSPYAIVLADHDSLRHSARALHRTLTRTPQHKATHLIWLYGEKPVSDELREHTTLLSKATADVEWRNTLLFSRTYESQLASASDMGTPLPSETDVEGTVADPIVASPISDYQPPASLEAARLLLVEDNPVNRLVAEKMLTTYGINYDVAQNGLIALSMMSENRYDMVLMDCQMPVLDGYTATRRWREQEAQHSPHQHLVIVAITANVMADDRQRCLDAGMDDYLSKPIMRDQLEACFRRWLKNAPKKVSIPDKGNGTGKSHSGSTSVASSVPVSPVSNNSDLTLDFDVLDELKAIAGNDTIQIVSIFLASAPQFIRQLEGASAQTPPDMKTLREAAHTLKSSSANVGAMKLSTAARDIEMNARTNTLSDPAAAVAIVANEFYNAQVALQNYLSTFTNTIDNVADH